MKAEHVDRYDDLTALWEREEQQSFTGWDFSYLDGRVSEEQPPWSYMGRAATLMDQASSVLDMGTGGGERLLELRDHWPVRVAVTEDYAPNVRLATERLAPLGVSVTDVALTRDGPMPFADGEFDLVLNRHSGYNPHEVARVLASGGTFLTQQIDGRWARDLVALFGADLQFADENLATSVAWLEDAGLHVLIARDWCGSFRFTDVGAVVYYLKAIPWIVDGFSVQTHLDVLLTLQERLESGRPLSFEARKFLIEASGRGS